MASARIISIGGGKDGVGKTVVASNLAVAMAQLGARVVFIDADVGSAGKPLFGLSPRALTQHAALLGPSTRVADCVVRSEEANLSFVYGLGTCLTGDIISPTRRHQLLEEIGDLDCEAVVIDAGGGVTEEVLDLFDLAHLRLVVMTPPRASIQNSYSYLKAAVLRTIMRAATSSARIGLVKSIADPDYGERIRDLMTRVHEADPRFGVDLMLELGRFNASIIGNLVSDTKDVGVFHAVSRMIQDFLEVKVPVLGHLPRTGRLYNVEFLLRPLARDAPKHEFVLRLRRIAETLLAADIDVQRPLPTLARAEAALEPDPVVRSRATPAPHYNEPLPGQLTQYMRRHERYPVAWTACLQGPTSMVAVGVNEVSLSGACIEPAEPLPLGAQFTLIFEDLPDGPRVPVVVRRVLAGGKWVGLEFLIQGDVPAQINAAALAEQAARKDEPE